ncbi:MAG: SCO family protein [Caulobacterales bacterium]
MAGRIVQNGSRSERLERPGRSLKRSAGLVLAAALAATAPSLAGCGRPADGGQAAQSQGPGGPFNLVDQNARPVDQSVLRGKWSVVFFGYTFCPDFCPTTLATLARSMNLLGPKAAKVQVVFISVDPARDTPAQLKTYLASPAFPKNVVGLTGSPAQVDKAAKAYVVYYQKAGTGPNYTVDHSTALYLMDPDGRFVRPIADGLTPDEVARQISEAMSGT